MTHPPTGPHATTPQRRHPTPDRNHHRDQHRDRHPGQRDVNTRQHEPSHTTTQHITIQHVSTQHEPARCEPARCEPARCELARCELARWLIARQLLTTGASLLLVLVAALAALVALTVLLTTHTHIPVFTATGARTAATSQGSGARSGSVAGSPGI
jgi:hypothetical protein